MPTKTIKRTVPNDEDKENEEYDVENIWRYDPKRDRYLVKWLSYPRPTWEPIENLANCMDMVNRRRVKQKLTPLPQSNVQRRCGAVHEPGTELNPGNWVLLEDIRQRLESICTKRFKKDCVQINDSIPSSTPTGNAIFIMCAYNHSVGAFFRLVDQVMYIYDSQNCWFSDNAIKQELEPKLSHFHVQPVYYNHQSKNDYCGSQLIAASVELLSWHRRGLIPQEIVP